MQISKSLNNFDFVNKKQFSLLVICGSSSFFSRILFSLSTEGTSQGLALYGLSVLFALTSFVALRFFLKDIQGRKDFGCKIGLLLQASAVTLFATSMPLFPDVMAAFGRVGGRNGNLLGATFFILSFCLVSIFRSAVFFISEWGTSRIQLTFGLIGQRLSFFIFTLLVVCLEGLWMIFFPLFSLTNLFFPASPSWRHQKSDLPWVTVDPLISTEGREQLSVLKSPELAQLLKKQFEMIFQKSFRSDLIDKSELIENEADLFRGKIFVLPETFLNIEIQDARVLTQEFFNQTGAKIWFGFRSGTGNFVFLSEVEPLSGRLVSGIGHQKRSLVPYFEKPLFGFKSALASDASEKETKIMEDEWMPRWIWKRPASQKNQLTAIGEEAVLICYEGLRLQNWLGIKANSVFIFTNHESFSKFRVLGLVYDGQLRWLASLLGKSLVLSANDGTSGVFDSFDTHDWNQKGVVRAQHLEMAQEWWIK